VNFSVLIAKTYDDPTQSISWLVPKIGELIYGGIASLLVFFMLFKFGWPAAKKALETLLFMKDVSLKNTVAWEA